MEYSAEVQKRFAATLQRGSIGGGAELVCGDAQDRTLGVWVQCSMEAAAGAIRSIHFQVFGCPDTVAAAHRVAEILTGASLQDVDGIDVHGLADELGIPIEKLGKLLRIEDAVLACKEQVIAKNGMR